jgi:hypothetical protein
MSEDYWINYMKKKKEVMIKMGKSETAFRETVAAHKASLIIGKDFGEEPETYLKRRNLKKYWAWQP